MDSNGTRFILIKGARDFSTSSNDCGWNPLTEAFMLTRKDQSRMPHLDPDRTLELWDNAIPHVLDNYGQIGRLSSEAHNLRRTFQWSLDWPGDDWQPVRATHEEGIGNDAADVTLDPVDAPAGTIFTDLHLGGSGLVALPYSNDTDTHGLLLTHLRRRWQAHCELEFKPLRAWVDGEDRVWLAGEKFLSLCRGGPLPQPYLPQKGRFEPEQPNPDPLRPQWHTLEPLPEHQGLLAMAANDEILVLLVKDASGAQQLLTRPLNVEPKETTDNFTTYPIPADIPFATDICLIDTNQILLLVPFEEGEQRQERRDCPLIQLFLTPLGTPKARLLPERWPRRSEAGDGLGCRFVRHRDNQPRTLTEDGPVQVHRLAQARFPHEGKAALRLPLDSGSPGTVWHRLYMEACIPPGCSIEVQAQVFEQWNDRSKWDIRLEDEEKLSESVKVQPTPSWLPITSELPFASGTMTPVPEQEGLFEILLQHDQGEARDLAGRYLWLRLILRGDGRHSPAVYAMRAWYPRFSWQTNFLPGHFHQQVPLPITKPRAAQDAANTKVEVKTANGADLRERLLACFEGLMTPIEERIAAAETLLYPDATPAPFLPWLAEMNATRLPQHWPEQRQRIWLAQQGMLQQQHGTFGGLCRALDIITDGGVGRGEVVPVEMFRLRRTLATVLGINMDDASHPLTLGTGQSGNSIVGETLILSEDHAREFLALFAPELASGQEDRNTVEHLFDNYARRLTVILHGSARLLRQTVAEALPGIVPAVVQWQIIESDHPFVLGLSPLLGIDTYLEKQPVPGRIQLDHTLIGRGDLIQNPVALSPENVRLPEINQQGGWA